MRGVFLAKFLHDEGAKVVGISDAYGALYDPEGLDIDYLLDKRDSFGTVTRQFFKQDHKSRASHTAVRYFSASST
ncbi:hypothetical protein GCM10020331_025510 [Ectobacillus funiculus]